VVQQGGLSAAEVAGQDGDGHSGILACRRHRFLRGFLTSKGACGWVCRRGACREDLTTRYENLEKIGLL
jgi:hypothetical protein